MYYLVTNSGIHTDCDRVEVIYHRVRKDVFISFAKLALSNIRHDSSSEWLASKSVIAYTFNWNVKYNPGDTCLGVKYHVPIPLNFDIQPFLFDMWIDKHYIILFMMTYVEG